MEESQKFDELVANKQYELAFDLVDKENLK